MSGRYEHTLRKVLTVGSRLGFCKFIVTVTNSWSATGQGKVSEWMNDEKYW